MNNMVRKIRNILETAKAPNLHIDMEQRKKGKGEILCVDNRDRLHEVVDDCDIY